MTVSREPEPLAPLDDSRQLARVAWRGFGDDSFAEVMRQSMRSMAHDDPETHAALADEGAAFGSLLDLHLEDDSAPSHSVAATALTAFVDGLAKAVKEISKSTLKRERYRTNLLLTGVEFGSVKVSLATPPQKVVKNADILERTFVEDADARSLALVTALLSVNVDADGTALEALAASLPLRARAGLRKASQQIAKENWRVSGSLARPGKPLENIAFDATSARRVGIALSSSHRESKRIELSGRVDGSRRSLLVMYFEPDKGRPFAAAVPDTELYESVVGMDAPDLRVTCKFRVDTVIAAGTDSVVRSSHTLESIRVLGEQGTLA
ncbi:hypothetical protein RN607_05480 [Demequina capsici]|uniref:Uncharacterized protein n=1 Tax=Demequina capsici TaxID=3075620 RepID=A0AA96JBU2_9MICO|nr:hypothetical protein [Demequina sp. PMTSA13]WNM28453.1 hypothetical protein RN607_05480 [Demequina sp. PMTSA13]